MQKYYSRILPQLALLFFIQALLTPLFSQIEYQELEKDWYEFYSENNLTPDNFFTQLSNDLPLTQEDFMQLYKTREDDLGNTHFFYQRYYKGILVDGNTCVLHAKNGKVFSANGELSEIQGASSAPSLSKSHARDLAISAVASELFIWEDPASEEELKMEKGESATFYPEGELLFRKNQSDTYVLAWKFTVSSLAPLESWEIYIDAKSGSVIDKISRIYNCNPYQGSANTLYDGPQTLTIDQRSPNNGFYLEDCEKDIQTRVFLNAWWPGSTQLANITPRSWAQISKVAHNHANWGNADQVETSAQWIAEESWDYLNDNFNWKGLDGEGRRIRILTQMRHKVSGILVPNNYYYKDKELVMIGALPDGSGGFNHMSTIHHVAHEIFHGVVANTANLEAEKEAGSLHEGYCDIFSIMVEEQATGSINWALCSDVGSTSAIVRNAEDPNSSDNPAKIGDDFYRDQNCGVPDPNNDFCFIHLNASILGRAFNLLSGSTNPNQNGVSVPGIGTNKAFNIAFRALRDGYLTKTSNFADARAAWRAVARMIYGPCSLEEYAVQNAWGAVGVGNTYNLCTEILGPSVLMDCNSPTGLANFRASAPAGSQISWNIPSNWNYSISGNNGENLRLISLPSGSTSGTIHVSANYQGTTVIDNHSFSLSSCFQQQRISETARDWNLYPNPAQRYSLLETNPSLLGGEYVITDVNGKKLLKGSIETPLLKVGLDKLAPGLYFLSLLKGPFHSVKKLQITR